MKEILDMLEEVMDLDAGTLEAAAILSEIEEWDSLSALSLMAEAKKNYGKILSADEINSFVTVQDIIDFLQK